MSGQVGLEIFCGGARPFRKVLFCLVPAIFAVLAFLGIATLPAIAALLLAG
jgi:hypothetical protein